MQRFFLISIFWCICVAAYSQQALFIPDTLNGTSINLRMHIDSVQFFPGKITQTFAFNTNKYLGPTLILKKGDHITIHVKNEINDTTTLHWHGMHVPAIWDGGPHSQILNGQTWSPQFTVMNSASTFWYHPHFMGKTALQAIKGAVGLIIVRDDEEAALNLPRRYGVDDFPIIVQCKQFDSLNQAMPRAMQDSTLIVNGVINPFVNMPSQVIRMRLLNASGERSFNFGFTNNKIFYVIGNDGGLLKNSISTSRIRLSPGERAEILIDLSTMNGQSIYLKSYASEIPVGVQGGPTMPMPPGSPPMNSPLNGIDFNILKINIVSATVNPVTVVPSVLASYTPYPESQAAVSRKITMTPLDSLTMDGPFFFNDSSFDMMRIDYRIPLNNIEIWSITNKSMVAHPFHIHDVQFYILDRDGNLPPLAERGKKDVVLIEPNETVRFITKFEDFADTTVPYMYHCHILMHEDDGMMGQFLVVPANSAGVKQIQTSQQEFTIYPNPATAQLLITTSLVQNPTDLTVEIFDLKGLKMGNINPQILSDKTIQIDISKLDDGMYFVKLNNKVTKFIKH